MRYLFKALKEIRRASRYQPLSIFGTIVTIFLAMLLPGLFWVAANNLSAVEQKLKINMTVDVFLQEGVSQADIEKLGSRFLELENITEVIFYSKQDALYKMREAFAGYYPGPGSEPSAGLIFAGGGRSGVGPRGGGYADR
jgi:cell division transport system permease protein